MARPLRIEYPGAVYHVINRGVNRCDIFHRDKDYEMFLDKLSEQAEKYHVQIRAYCLMKNHFHLYLSTPEANLSKYMQSMLTAYTVSKNRRDRRSGHLFGGRYKAHLVEDDIYGDAVGRYVHLNPVRTRRAKSLPVDERRDLLRSFPWSSYGAVVGLRKCPEWLARDAVLQRWGERRGDRQSGYAQYVELGMLNAEDPFEGAVGQCIVGSEGFVEQVRRLYIDVSSKINTRREQGQGVQALTWLSFERLQEAVASAYAVEAARLVARYQRGNEARLVLQYLATRRCRGRYSLSELSDRVGISVSGLSSASQRCERLLKKSRRLQRRIADIEKALDGSDSAPKVIKAKP